MSTKHARAVLSDCEAALVDLREAWQDQLRRRWVTTVALLRAVGHVLHKVDGAADPGVAAIVAKEWEGLQASKPQPDIFWRFIEEERNQVLKVYRFSVRGNLTIGIPPGSSGTIYSPDGITSAPTSTFEICAFSDGPFAGQHPLEVVASAITFWHQLLDRVDAETSSAK